MFRRNASHLGAKLLVSDFVWRVASWSCSSRGQIVGERRMLRPDVRQQAVTALCPMAAKGAHEVLGDTTLVSHVAVASLQIAIGATAAATGILGGGSCRLCRVAGESGSVGTNAVVRFVVLVVFVEVVIKGGLRQVGWTVGYSD